MRRALVTGAGIRVGRAIALELATSGFEVAVHYNGSAGPAEAVVAEIRAQGGQAFAVQADLSDDAGRVALMDAVSARWDGLEVLVNNASVFAPKPFAEITREDWDWMQEVNLVAPFRLSQLALPLLERGHTLCGAPEQKGVVVQLCDIGAERPVRGFTAYSVSKAGLVMLVKSMAIELAPTIRTVGVSPGQVIWPEDYDEAKRARLASRIPLERVGTPEDIARLTRFLVLEAPYINGEIIAVDGGLSQRY